MEKKILIIDDEVDFTKMVKLNLEKTNKYKVEIENKGSNGLAAAQKHKPDLIFLDLMIPDLEGGEIACLIKEDKSLQDIPIVFLTAIISENEAAYRDGRIGGQPFIAKPVSTESLVACIEENIR